jgi:hypothetical protein
VVKGQRLLPRCDDRHTEQTVAPTHFKRMHTFFTVLMGILLLSVLGVLVTGMVGMARGVDPRRSNRLMQWRIVLQAAAILLFAIMMSLLRS